jgi:2-keto-4-pentenoate hydratase/2-oxohepta-3-ene-1,7-dioic acid hydratase in catechol pathway
MTHWLRFEHQSKIGFGVLDADNVRIYDGDMFDHPHATGEVLPVDQVTLLTPVLPQKLIALWNNYRALAEKLGQAIPLEPLYFIKTPNSYLAHKGVIQRPLGYEGKIIFEGELGIVIGKTCKAASIEDAESAIFGYTCFNDVTALDLLNKDSSFTQWTRAKSCDTFGAFGPVIATGLDPQTLTVRTLLNGKERQNYPCSDMIFSPPHIVSMLSREMTLYPGDVIACGTSLGVAPMRSGNVVEVIIDGIGSLQNTIEEQVI